MNILHTSLIATVIFFSIVEAKADESRNVQCRTVRADIEWQGTGIFLNESDFVCVKAKGLWSHGGQGIQAIIPFYGPKGFGKDDPINIPEVVSRVGALIAKIDGHAPFLIENHLCFIPQAPGELFLSMNDDPGTFGNNQGELKVRIAKGSASSHSKEAPKSNEFMTASSGNCFK